MKQAWFAALVIAFFTHTAQADITIAAVGPFTGQDAAAGDQHKRGVEAAVAEINERGGVLGQKLKLVMKDDACDPRQAVAVANQLAAEGVKYVVGHICSGASIPASKIYAEENMIMVSPASTNPKLTEQGYNTIFRVCGRDDQQGKVIGDYILRKFAGKKVAVLDDQTAYGKGIADVVKATVKAGGVKDVLYENIAKGERDFSALLAKLKNANVGVIFYGGYYTEAGLLARQMKDRGVQAQLIGPDDITSSAFWSIAGEAGEGTLVSFLPDPRNNPGATAAVKRIRATGYEPESYTLYSYAGVQLIADAINQVGKNDTTAVAKMMHAATFDTPLGKIKFDQKGDVDAAAYVLYQWTKGNYVMLKDQ